MPPSSGMPQFQAELLSSKLAASGLSCEAVAVLAGVSPETVRRAVKGRGKPSPRVVAALAKALDVKVTELAPASAPQDVTLRQLRQRKGATQKAFAEALGVSPQMVGRVEHGVYGVRDRARWAAVYGVSEARWTRAWQAGRTDQRRRIRARTTPGGTE